MKTTAKCPQCSHEFPINLTMVACQRCGHRWVPRTLDVRQCPKCQSVRWDTPRERTEPAAATPARASRQAAPNGNSPAAEDSPTARLRRLKTALPQLTGTTRREAEAKITELEKAVQNGMSP